ncbi:MAG TPA: hypothetical protein VF285_11375 [Castellaniella sp.]|uniref:hypothetical protein n=1 Tax=Castellaniella sp. TaxID=1955812 RepID=UPI002F00F8B7
MNLPTRSVFWTGFMLAGLKAVFFSVKAVVAQLLSLQGVGALEAARYYSPSFLGVLGQPGPVPALILGRRRVRVPLIILRSWSWMGTWSVRFRRGARRV